jgi:creatinine amidohydrolase
MMLRPTLVRVPLGLALLLLLSALPTKADVSTTGTPGKPLVLQEMTWPEVKDYLTRSEMVIIPLGSTEQHGPALPLGTDCYHALDISKQISVRTGVVVAPVLLVGYSSYHSGFPGTLSVSPETMERVLFEVAEYLIKYGFRRIMFFNYHGGNSLIEATVIHRINHETEATAIAIGIGSPIQQEEESDSLDYHAGVEETSSMLYLEPGLVRMDKAQKPVMHFTPQVKELQELSKKNPELESVWHAMLGVPAETKKGGSSSELSSNGVWSLRDPRAANAELGKEMIQDMVDRAVKFIEAWNQAIAR